MNTINMLSKTQLKKSVASLQAGRVIAFPTETVYALAGDARNILAVKKIFALKNRPLNQPLSVLLPENYVLEEWADDISSMARHLANYFWPGPLTLILKKNQSVLPELTGGQLKIGLRVPNHPTAQSILKAFSGGLAAPSANRSTHFSPTQAVHVYEEFGDQLDVVDGGDCSIGIESTIVDVTTSIPKIVRLGAISQQAIQNVIACEAIQDLQSLAPRKSLMFQQIATTDLQKVIYEYLKQGKSVTVLARHTSPIIHKNLSWMTMPAEANLYGQVLYEYLRKAAQNSTDKILVESIPASEKWSGVRAALEKYSIT